MMTRAEINLFCFVACAWFFCGDVTAQSLPPAPLTVIDQSLDTSSEKAVNPIDTPQSAPAWRYPHTPFKVRFALFAGDQAGGPIRFNTHFPSVKTDPHPASYFHGMPIAGGEFEYAFKWGGVLLGAQLRRDMWHPGIKGRSAMVGAEQWSIDEFSVNSTGLVIGWVFGERYREAPWVADLALVYDRGSADATFYSTSGTAAIGQVSIEAMALRCRIHFNTVASRALAFGVGPDIHVPLWASTADRSDAVLEGSFKDHVQLETSAALGYSLITSFRF